MMTVTIISRSNIFAIEQRQTAGARAAEMKKRPRGIDSGLLDEHEHDDYDTDEWQDRQSNGEADSDEIKDLNIGKN